MWLPSVGQCRQRGVHTQKSCGYRMAYLRDCYQAKCMIAKRTKWVSWGMVPNKVVEVSGLCRIDWGGWLYSKGIREPWNEFSTKMVCLDLHPKNTILVAVWRMDWRGQKWSARSSLSSKWERRRAWVGCWCWHREVNTFSRYWVGNPDVTWWGIVYKGPGKGEGQG